uniref:Uncharacterized protein n=1 Tax=Trichogramma kaykai TaxID=54128 RepID=A0ABD2WSF7_9HYME
MLACSGGVTTVLSLNERNDDDNDTYYTPARERALNFTNSICELFLYVTGRKILLCILAYRRHDEEKERYDNCRDDVYELKQANASDSLTRTPGSSSSTTTLAQ